MSVTMGADILNSERGNVHLHNFRLITVSGVDCIKMARGHQKIQSQQKNKEKQEKMKKSQSHDQKKAAQAGLKFVCTACKSQMPDPKTYKQHFENKHPKLDLPDELKEI
ncbi:zinc finger protein 706-like [Ruditapes philippinarum]|uniref:zinc finger protein 706-like n=1 Tax=Ruditapes philippinarum TaxID=129788 RepID=UPI00295AA73A|nr:zinc finger protein 706-like [Ruditapes philippinarum]